MSQRIYTLKKDAHDPRDFVFTSPKKKLLLPRSVDLRSKMSPIVDQGQLGSCTSNAMVSGMREYYLLLYGAALVRLSRLDHYYHERLLEGTVSEDSGAQIRDGMKVLADIGVCPEDIWPYIIANFTDAPSAEAEAASAQYKISSYHRVTSLNDLKAALADGHPVVIGIAIYESFESFDVEMSGIVPIPNPKKEQMLGGHAVLVVGYDDDKNVVIVRNSWGDQWGDHGYCTLPYAYISNPNLTWDMWVGIVDAPQPDPTPTPDPGPQPNPDPIPDPTPTPDPGPEPNPTPDPGPQPDPVPTPDPGPQPDPTPGPLPEVQKEIGVIDNIGLDGVKGYLIDNVSYLPARLFAEAMGLKVDWDGNNVIITKE